jgi:hypothetical protein
VTIKTTNWAMTSDRTPEYAYRVEGAGAAVWRLTWLPDHRLTREQALAGMQLDELLSDPDLVQDTVIHGQVATLAAMVGVQYEHAVILLSRRMLKRLNRTGPAGRRLAGGSRPARHGQRPEPRVFG